MTFKMITKTKLITMVINPFDDENGDSAGQLVSRCAATPARPLTADPAAYCSFLFLPNNCRRCPVVDIAQMFLRLLLLVLA